MEDKRVTISITTGAVVKAILVLALAWLAFYLRGLVLVVLTAIVIASAIEPAVSWLSKRKVPRVLAVIIVYILLFIAFFGIFYFFLPSLFDDFATFVTSLPTYLNAFSASGAFGQYAHILGVSAPQTVSSSDLMNAVRGALNLGSAFSNVFSAIASVFGGLFSFILIVVFSFYFAVIETGVDDFLRIVTPSSHRAYVQGLWRRSQHKIGLWMQGQLLLAVIMGILVYLGLTILGVPHALTLAVIAGCFEIIPVFGPILSAVPGVIIAFVNGGLAIGIAVVVLYVIFQQFENHLIYPLVVTRVVGVPPLLVILALIVGWQLAGFLGIILSVPAAATIQEFVRDLEMGRLRQQAK